MGVGKTTTGSRLAPALQYRFVDTDQLIEAYTKQTISQIFAKAGEAEFRQIEHQVLSQVSAHTRLVVATGGGIVLDSENWGYLKTGIVIWLDMGVDQLYKRLRGNSQRPLMQSDDPLATLHRIYEERRSLYAEADICLQVNELETAELVCDRLLQVLAGEK